MFGLFKQPMLDVKSQNQIVESLKLAETKTSGEIRVYMEHHCRYVDPMMRAREVFMQLKMGETHAHNAVLIYLAVTDRQFALLGDHAIYEKAGGPEFWKKAAAALRGHFQKSEIANGISNCIHELGIVMAAHFPVEPGIKRNELPDEIVFGK